MCIRDRKGEEGKGREKERKGERRGKEGEEEGKGPAPPFANFWIRPVYPVYTMTQNIKKHQTSIKQTLIKYKAYIKHSLHEANIEQTSSKRQANIKQLEHMSCTCILNTFA